MSPRTISKEPERTPTQVDPEAQSPEREGYYDGPEGLERMISVASAGAAGAVQMPDEERPESGFPGLRPAQTNLTTTSNKPYSAFSNGQKWFIVIFSALGAIFSPISTIIYAPAIPTLVEAFHTTTEKINLTVTVYLIFQALTPSIWGSAGDSYGRRPIFIICLLVYLLGCVGSALCPTNAYWLLMLMRIVQSSGGSPVIAIGAGIIADIAPPQERGRYLGIYNLTSTMGPTLGPLIGGLLSYGLGWRSIFWFLVIFCGAVTVPMIFFFPETLRSLVGDGSIPPPLANCTVPIYLHRRKEKKMLEERGEQLPVSTTHRAKFQPWSSFTLLLEPEIALMFLSSSLYYALWYALLTIFSSLLKTEYGKNDVIIGLCYIPNGAGSAISGYLSGRIMDIIILVASILGVAWSMEVHAPMAVPVVLNFFVGVGTGFLTTTTIYGIDSVPGKGGAVTASFNLVRCAFGAVTVSTVQLICDRIGVGWCFVLLSAICVASSPLLLLIVKYGPIWRARRKAKDKAKEAEKKAQGASYSPRG
ncbi:hypothetical protein L198_03990 [Cryptococcus wingfieldii CBS 7118]|uniref:Major facilitator superfamily (MFS) profile domain-containing protein n=1 Tax=Cryptococcus wingfieldii CBS 7118 TaxID=1295528 RepID=A0A1E3JBD9_9TREE|nr:hypothetical protein L198_03990 [Cryptococcus wingfieldii CBS 7118]ODN97426.1 hypothetical protein L198_03990 [Cryptococcus wingfieldii CBS 7118]